ncbi:hypothetical protein JN09_001340 [Acholeplasma morum]|uniref:hypothetical protein n=1 Tax=Paracholeplasma morum TaxID=264637 RepID=UPI00195B7027|nr:hypothetical protein [Paracholeplasma morum]MBM7453997.1 hypothetical protein [Paracholeplasma morum]
MKSILTLEKEISEVYKKIPKVIELVYNEINDQAIGDNEITKSILYRLHTFYHYQYELNTFYKRGYTPPAADFFTETVLYYLNVFCKINKLDYEIKSEVAIKRKRGSIRPDISIWKGEDVIAIIECKTQLGYNRHSWQEDFQSREQHLKKDFPMAKAFLLVMTARNWKNNNGFANYLERGKKYFVLTDRWPSEIDFNVTNQEYIIDCIEPLFEQLSKL